MQWKSRGFYWYVHDKKLRESYDTYKVIESLAESGFQERQSDVNNNIYIMQNIKENKSKK